MVFSFLDYQAIGDADLPEVFHSLGVCPQLHHPSHVTLSLETGRFKLQW